MKKVKAYRCTEELGGQYRDINGQIIFVGEGAIVVNALEESMWFVDKGKKVVRFGFEAVYDYVPPATPLDVKLAESQELKRLSDENNKLKAALEAKADAKD